MDRKRLLHDIRARPVNFVPGKKVVSIAPGEWTSPYEGKGYEPLGYRDFEIGDDPRRINIPATARRGVTTIVERVALRDFKILVVVDCSPSMRVREKLDIQLGAVGLLLYSALQCETTFGLASINKGSVNSFGMGIGAKHFYNLFRRLMNLFFDDPLKALKGTRKLPLSRCLPPNAMLIYCSDFLQADGNLTDLGSLRRRAQRYDFIPVIIQDDFEYSFPIVPYGTFLNFTNPETGNSDEAWITPKSSGNIKRLHELRYQNLVTELGSIGTSSIHLSTPDILKTGELIGKFFRRRVGRKG